MMKFLIVYFVCGVAVSNAFDIPQTDTADGRFVTEGVENALKALSERIKEYGLDPLIIKRREYRYGLAPLYIGGFIEDLQFSGLSNIVINSLNFSMATYKATFDISLPELFFSIRNSSINAVLFNNSYNAAYSGSLRVKEIRLAGEVVVIVEKDIGVNIQDLSLDFSLGGIEAKVRVNIQGQDLSEEANKALNVLIPNYLQEHRNEIDRVLENISWELISQIM